jgi:hypothetical protein
VLRQPKSRHEVLWTLPPLLRPSVLCVGVLRPMCVNVLRIVLRNMLRIVCTELL